MDAQELELRIAGLGHNATSFVRLMTTLGDPRPHATIQRSLTNYLNGTHRIPGELIAVLNLLRLHPEDAKLVKTRRQGRPVISPGERARKLLTA